MVLTDILFQPPFPPQQVLGLGVLLVLLALGAYHLQVPALGRGRAAVLAGLRVLLVAALTVLLLRPMRPAPAPEPGAKPPFCVLLDTSASMDAADVDGVTRHRAAVEALVKGTRTFLRELAERVDVRVYEFSTSTEAATLGELRARERVEGEGTDLAQALGAAAGVGGAGEHAGVLLVSDGRHNGGEGVHDTATMLKTRGVPVWTACVGTPVDAADLAVTARLSQNFLFVGQPATLKVQLSHSGLAFRRVNVHLHREDRYLTTRQVMLGKGTTYVEFPVDEAAKGLFKYRVAVDPLGGEGDVANNQRTVFARVVDQKTKVLVVEARPHWDSKFMLRALRADPNLDVTSVFYVSPTKVFAIREQTSAETLEEQEVAVASLEMPRTKDRLYVYDCLVLGRDMDSLMSAEEMRLLKDYLTERGGSVVFFRGKPYAGDSPLAALEPMAWAEGVLRDARLELTPEGRISPVFAFGQSQPPDVIVRTLPAMTSVTRIEREKSLAVILAVGESAGSATPMAAMAFQRYGKGKVMSIGASGLWRWDFMAPELSEYDNVYERFWRQVIQWLVFESDFLPGQDIAFRTTAYTYTPGSRVAFAVSTKHVDTKAYRPRIDVHAPGGGTVTLEPTPHEGRPTDYSALFVPETEGEYKAVLHNNVGSPREDVVRFTVYSDMVERRLVATDEDLLARVSATTGGELLALEELDKLPAKVKAFAVSSSQRAKPVDAWDAWQLLVFLSVWVGVEWYLRRRWGVA